MKRPLPHCPYKMANLTLDDNFSDMQVLRWLTAEQIKQRSFSEATQANMRLIWRHMDYLRLSSNIIKTMYCIAFFSGTGSNFYGMATFNHVDYSFNMFKVLPPVMSELSHLFEFAPMWTHFMCHHETWPTSLSHPLSFLNRPFGLHEENITRKYYRYLWICIQHVAFPCCFPFIFLLSIYFLLNFFRLCCYCIISLYG